MKRIRKITSVILAVIMVIGVITIAPFSVSAASCIKTQAQALDWLKAQEGTRHNLDNAYGSQCSDFVSAYVNLLLYGSTTAGKFGVYNANQYSNKNLYPSDWQVIPNTASFVPQPGDIFITAGSTSYGHTGVVISSNVNTATIVDQNGMGDWSLENGSPAHIHNITWTSSGTWSPKYFIRPAFAPAGNNPTGVVDIIEGGQGYIHVRGWAFDKDDLSAQLTLHVYIGGRSGDPNAECHAIIANTKRPDVNSVYGCGDWHGFDAKIYTSKTGKNNVYIYALNVGPGNTNPQVGEGSATILNEPIDFGYLFYARIVHHESGKMVTQEEPVGNNYSNVALYENNYDYSSKFGEQDNYQLWKFERQSDLSYKIINTKTGHCLDVSGASSANGTNIIGYPDNGSNAQRWYLVSGRNDYSFSLIPKNAQLSALDLTNNNSSNGSNIQLYQINYKSAQLFDIYQDSYILDEVKHNGNTYQLHISPMSWEESKNLSENFGGHLATFTTEIEFNIVKDMLEKHNYPKSWLGATSITGDWVWITGENFTYSNWDSNQPDNYNNVEYYCATWENAKWNDYSVDNSNVFSFICEIEGNPTGDVNCDDVVNITDATTIQKYLVESVSLSEEQIELADTNGNGIVEIQDVTTIQKYLSGKISQLPYKK